MASRSHDLCICHLNSSQIEKGKNFLLLSLFWNICLVGWKHHGPYRENLEHGQEVYEYFIRTTSRRKK